MDLDTLRLKALIQHAEKVPDAALPHLGSLAHLGLWLSGASRRRFFRAMNGIFGSEVGGQERGLQQLLIIDELDHDLRKDVAHDANRLRDETEREHPLKFFRALRAATILKEHFGLILDVFEDEGEGVLWSIFDGTAFRSGGLVSMLIEEPSAPAPKGKPGRRACTGDIAVFVNELRLQGKTWKEVRRACNEKFPDRIKTIDQVRTIWRRHFGGKVA